GIWIFHGISFDGRLGSGLAARRVPQLLLDAVADLERIFPTAGHILPRIFHRSLPFNHASEKLRIALSGLLDISVTVIVK
ncbi:hypothetical protein Q6316_29720, partial [Klebsiella pneumoniae]|nr:hypothetical protein [Klebsiella pneumoniae]